MKQTIHPSSTSALDIHFEVKHSLLSVHTRIGAGYFDASLGDTSIDTRGFFLPKTNEDDPAVEECPLWTVLARSLGTTVELIAIPGSTRFEPDARFYLRAIIAIPQGHEVTNIDFYGDDGNSSLSPTLDEDSDIKEGRQSVGFLVKYSDLVSQEVRTELWLFRYDDFLFKRNDFKTNVKNGVTILGAAVDEREFIRLVSDNEECDASSIIVPKSELVAFVPFEALRNSGSFSHTSLHIHIPSGRLISTHRDSQNQRRSQVKLCGSRGTGGVLTFGAPTCLNIFDLEEDEDSASAGV